MPAIVNWAPYGKGDTGFWVLDNKKMFPNRFGIRRSAVSGLQSWEGNDPAYWCSHGYAVVQVDARGAFDSEGDIHYLNSAEGRDGHDAVEAIAALPWCSGKVGLAGNSWLAMSQWRTASEQPPHLAAIAPWEGLTDLYREVLARGGVPRTAFPAFIRDKMYGRGRVEDPIAMLEDHPLFDGYWADKLPDLPRIRVLAYVVASYSDPVMSPARCATGRTCRGRSGCVSTTARSGRTSTTAATSRICACFFDRYLRGTDNGWEATPPVRMSVLDPGHADTVERVEESFPPPRVTATELFLDARDHSLRDKPPAAEATTGYRLADEAPHADFTYRFDADTEVIGYPVLTVGLGRGA